MSKKYNNFKSTIKVLNTTGTEILPYKQSRSAVILYNQSSNTVRLWLDTEAAYIVMPGNTGLEFLEVGINVMNAKTESGSATITIWEA